MSVDELLNVVELVIAEDTAPAGFSASGIKINILKCWRF